MIERSLKRPFIGVHETHPFQSVQVPRGTWSTNQNLRKTVGIYLNRFISRLTTTFLLIISADRTGISFKISHIYFFPLIALKYLDFLNVLQIIDSNIDYILKLITFKQKLFYPISFIYFISFLYLK